MIINLCLLSLMLDFSLYETYADLLNIHFLNHGGADGDGSEE
jgi:hypothetical protein